MYQADRLPLSLITWIGLEILMESLGTDLVDQEISVFGMKAVTEEIGNVKAGLIGDGDLPKWGLGHFTHFVDFIAISSYIKLRSLIG